MLENICFPQGTGCLAFKYIYIYHTCFHIHSQYPVDETHIDTAKEHSHSHPRLFLEDGMRLRMQQKHVNPGFGMGNKIHVSSKLGPRNPKLIFGDLANG